MLTAIPFAEWTPDLAPSNSPHLSVAQNVIPIANGYTPVKDYAAFTPSILADFTGGGSFVSSTGEVFLIVGRSDDRLLRYEGGAWNTTFGAGYAVGNGTRFAQFGDNIMFTEGGTLSAYNMGTGSFATATTGYDEIIDVARVRDFVAILTSDDQVVWSEFNNALSWVGGTNQSDYQPLLGGGKAVAIVGGEYGIVLQRQSITRMTYVGEPQGIEIIFQFDEISPEIGCIARGTVCNIGRLIFFLSDRGFEMCDGETVTPISDEKFNRWFFANHTRADIETMSAAIDPQNSLVMWCMPGSPGRLIVYNWVLQRGSVISLPVAAIFSGFSQGVSLEGADAIYPSGLESIDVSLDDPLFEGGAPALLLVDHDFTVGTLSGPNMEATLQQSNVELSSGRRSRVRALRAITDATTVEATLNMRMKTGDAEASVYTATMRPNGKLPVRANGRYATLTLTIPAGEEWSYIQGCEWEYEAGDGR